MKRNGREKERRRVVYREAGGLTYGKTDREADMQAGWQTVVWSMLSICLWWQAIDVYVLVFILRLLAVDGPFPRMGNHHRPNVPSPIFSVCMLFTSSSSSSRTKNCLWGTRAT